MQSEDIKMLVQKWWEIYNDSLDYEKQLRGTGQNVEGRRGSGENGEWEKHGVREDGVGEKRERKKGEA
ncbi:putative galactinol synthase 1-like [Sesbania bispinosa]|nr:putative galactinol synthase 1-like [Sesbania bispinosa]